MKNDAYPKVLITDETLRDGLQIERLGITIDEKLELLQMLTRAGLKRLVVGAFVNPKWSPQMGDTAELIARLVPQEGVEYLAIALNERGREMRRGMSPPLSIDPLPSTHLHLCDVFLLRNTNRTLEEQEQSWRMPIEKAVASGLTRAAIGLSAPWGSNWRGAFPQAQRMESLSRQWRAWHDAGIEVVRVDLADPMSWNSPDALAKDLRAIKGAFPSIHEFRLHLHNARGLAMLSVYEALRTLGPDDTLIVDSAVGGIGGCPYCGNGQAAGMIPTEDLVQLLKVLGIPTGVDLDLLVEAAHRLAELIERPLDGRVYKNGPLPTNERLYDMDMPAVYTLHEAQHFRLGASVYQGNARPWVKTPKASDTIQEK